jgi:mannitol-1-/sugar-/sorbitol-6-/2-deoxyglucose-6-phosphatase
MIIQSIIYDMDGLLIDSEPLWHQAAQEVLAELGIQMNEEAYSATIGLRTREFLHHWFIVHHINQALIPVYDGKITSRVIELVSTKGALMPGVQASLDLFRQRKFNIGLATSSPMELVEAMLTRTGLNGFFDAMTSASELPYGKPHPEVYLNCAEKLGSHPLECLCLEDSFNGMIAAKAARMKCIVVPEASVFHQDRWLAADLKLPSLEKLNAEILDKLIDR